MTISIRVGRMRHGNIGRPVIKQTRELSIDNTLVCSDQAKRPSLNTLGPLSGIAHDQNRLAQSGCLLLNTTRIGKNYVRASHEVVKIENLKRIDDLEPIETVKLRMSRISNNRIHVNWIHRARTLMLFQDPTNGPKHAMHGLTQILSTMSRNKNQLVLPHPVKNGMMPILAHCCSKSVYASVASNPYAFHGLAFRDEICLGGLGRGKVPAGHNIHRLTVKLLGPRAINIVGAQTRLDVAHGYLQIETS